MLKTLAFLLVFAFLGLGVTGIVMHDYRSYLFAAGTLCLVVGFGLWKLRTARES
ncbi:hypothetical protein [Blastopirellula marina]|uniref:Uncharacterized protein n=1 Tax=Blastopirellula marina DSM 3645 TaxID=314230 RepID=A4A049_9BACT|nr:hypothetical protein [Blastopirellula marina]EAQ77835.1 hypothetical protein DSM3645_06024 [Blastopirellula marina DSM 3645]